MIMKSRAGANQVRPILGAHADLLQLEHLVDLRLPVGGVVAVYRHERVAAGALVDVEAAAGPEIGELRLVAAGHQGVRLRHEDRAAREGDQDQDEGRDAHLRNSSAA